MFAVAFAVRLVCLLNFRSLPFFENLIVDSYQYDAWARRIATGDWLGNGVFFQAPLYPYTLGTIYAVLGRDLFWLRFGQIILGGAACVGLMRAGRGWFNRATGITAWLMMAH